MECDVGSSSVDEIKNVMQLKYSKMVEYLLDLIDIREVVPENGRNGYVVRA